MSLKAINYESYRALLVRASRFTLAAHYKEINRHMMAIPVSGYATFCGNAIIDESGKMEKNSIFDETYKES